MTTKARSNEIVEEKEKNVKETEIKKEETNEIEKEEILPTLEEENVTLKAELAKNKDDFLRKIAEYENIRKRSEKEKMDFIKFSNEKIILKLLEISDNLDRAILSTKDNSDLKSLIKGIKMTSGQIEKLFKEEGVKPIKCVGLEFDPYKHQAMMQEESKQPENIILEELQRGYTLKEKVIRPSLVKISKK